MKLPLLLAIPILVFYIIYLLVIFYDIKVMSVKYLPKWLWFFVCAISVPVGGVVYFLVGRKGTKDYDEKID